GSEPADGPGCFPELPDRLQRPVPAPPVRLLGQVAARAPARGPGLHEAAELEPVRGEEVDPTGVRSLEIHLLREVEAVQAEIGAPEPGTDPVDAQRLGQRPEGARG